MIIEHELGTITVADRDEDLGPLWTAMNGRGTWAADTETTGLKIYSAGYKVRIVQVGTGDHAWILRPDFPEHREAIVASVTKQDTNWHNMPFDGLSLEVTMGIPFHDIASKAKDTEVRSRLLDPRDQKQGGIGHRLKDLAEKWVMPGCKDARAEVVAAGRKYGIKAANIWPEIPLDDPVYLRYAGQDVLITARLADVQKGQIAERHLERFEAFELVLAEQCADMQRIGTLLDKEWAEEHRARMVSTLDTNESKLREQYHIDQTANYAHTSKKSLLRAFGEYAVSWSKFTEKTHEPCLDAEVLESIVDRGGEAAGLARTVLDAKKAKHYADYISTMLDLAGVDNRVHPDIRPLRAATARMSISSPPLQQLPKDDEAVRGCLRADHGDTLISADGSQIEFRIAAAVSGDPVMRSAIANGEDLHRTVAIDLYGEGFTKEQRDIAKGVGFGRLYRGQPKGLSAQTGIDLPTVKKAVKAFDRAYPHTAKWGEKVQQYVAAGNHQIVTATGRPLIVDRPWAACNYLIQSPARDVFAQGILNMHRAGLGPNLRLVVHDEVIVSVPTGEAEEYSRRIEDAMSCTFKTVEIEFVAKNIGERWKK